MLPRALAGRLRRWLFVSGAALTFHAAARADDWTIHITVDNQYDVYFGDSTSTDFHAGGDTSWPTTETWTALGRDPTDFLYVATASDHSVAQGFLAEFINTTQGVTIKTGDPDWDVFPAGAYLSLIDASWPDPWPPSLMPTQAQVDAAIAYATANNLWTNTTTAAGYDNASSPLPWGARPGIAGDADWIWYDTGLGPSSPYPAPFTGFNHDEFLVFRVPNIPEPAGAVLGLLGLLAVRRR
ncbi:MAG: hypothetical protein HRF50_06075 [Phycisphaerae bacterium]|jgi:hypothetical protein